MWDRKVLKERGKIAFKANYWWCVLASLVVTAAAGASGSTSGSSSSDAMDETNIQYLMSSGFNIGIFIGAILAILVIAMVVGLVINTFVRNPIEMGGCRFFLSNAEGKAQIGDIIAAFKNGYMNVVLTLFLRDLFVSLWSLLLVVPGIVKSYEYRMVPYILAECPTINHKEAFVMSKMMMSGQKWNAFVLDLSFLGWNILSIFTCGILSIFYVNPYIAATDAELYNALKNNI